MKVAIFPQFNHPDKGDGGIRRTVEGQIKYLPQFGVEIVQSVEEADVINCHAGDLIDTDKPLVSSTHGLYWTAENSNWDKWAWELNRQVIRAIKRADAVTAPSKWVAYALQRGMLVDPVVVYHGISLDEWNPDENHGYVLYNKSRVDLICDPTPVNELADRLPKQKFVTTYGQRTSNVKVVGRLPYSDMKPFVQSAGVYLATTRETFGVGTLEAMACGVPILGFNFGGQAEIVTHKENGYLARVGDYDDLAEGLLYCLEHRDRMGLAARQTVVERFQWHQVIEGYITAYERAMAVQKSPSVSVIVTAYKLEDYLSACIESVLNQDYQDWELIIVDDASPDRCGEIADAYASRDPRIKVVHNPRNVYLAEARNIGISHSTGKYILPLDADDRLDPRAVGILARSLDQDGDKDIVTGSMAVVEEDKPVWVSTWPPKNPAYHHQIAGHNQIPYASMYRRWVWERTGGYRRRMISAEDAEFWTRAMSFGANPAKVTDTPTLVYTNRSDSMSHSIATPQWNEWFTWSALPKLTPFGASDHPKDLLSWPVHSYEPTLVSVVVPVGPGHEVYLQDCLDSLVAQTLILWEVILVNDTGYPWHIDGKLVNRYLQGFPFARLVDIPHSVPKGPAWARNRGVEAAKASRIVFLDADDIAQPLMLEALYKAHVKCGGWVYTDWYNETGEKQEARSWDAAGLMTKQLGPITGIYAKKDWEAVGGFDENIPGWEDWDFQISLLEQEVCGSRLAYPLTTYRYNTGWRREDGFSKKDTILKYIEKKHKKLYKDRGFAMACRKCGSGGGKSELEIIRQQQQRSASSSTNENGWVLFEYVGLPVQIRQMQSHANRSRKYRYGGRPGESQRRVMVHPEDVDMFLSRPQDFRVADLKKDLEFDAPVRVENEPKPVLRVDRQFLPEPELPIDLLKEHGLRADVISILKNAQYGTIERLRFASPAELLSIKGISDKRVETIKGALNAFLAA